MHNKSSFPERPQGGCRVLFGYVFDASSSIGGNGGQNGKHNRTGHGGTDGVFGTQTA